MAKRISKFQKTINSTLYGFGGILLALNSVAMPAKFWQIPQTPLEAMLLTGQTIINTTSAKATQVAEAMTTDTPVVAKAAEPEKPAPRRVIYVTVTAYSSTPDQTDDTPFTTANGTHVHDGVIAANFLKFGTKVCLPDYSGEKEFTVEDRMHPRFSDRMDIWFPTREQATNFGIKKLKVEIY